MPNNKYNKRYLIRAIEQGGVNTNARDTPVENTIIVGITTESTTLKERIAVRARDMFVGDLLAEASAVAETYGWDIAPLRAPAYRIARRLLSAEIDVEEAITEQVRADWQLARKQMTWFRRNHFIVWRTLPEAPVYVRHKLAQWNRATI